MSGAMIWLGKAIATGIAAACFLAIVAGVAGLWIAMIATAWSWWFG